MKAWLSAYSGDLYSSPSTSACFPRPLFSCAPAREGIRGQKDSADSGVKHFLRSGSAEEQQLRSEIKEAAQAPRGECCEKG